MYAPISENSAADFVLYKTCFLTQIASFFCTDCLDSPMGREGDREWEWYATLDSEEVGGTPDRSVFHSPTLSSPSDCLETAELNSQTWADSPPPLIICLCNSNAVEGVQNLRKYVVRSNLNNFSIFSGRKLQMILELLKNSNRNSTRIMI